MTTLRSREIGGARSDVIAGARALHRAAGRRGRDSHSNPPAWPNPLGRAIRIGSYPRMRTPADVMPHVSRHLFDNARGALLLSLVAGPMRGNTRRANSAAGAVFPRRAGRISLISLAHQPRKHASQDLANGLKPSVVLASRQGRQRKEVPCPSVGNSVHLRGEMPCTP